MERNREARRGAMAAVNGGGLSRKRQRSNGLRDFPKDDEGMEIPETSRLRERASMRDRQRDRSRRSKRKRPERMMHGTGREEGEDSSEESLEEEEQDDDDQGMSHRQPRLPPALSPAPQSLLAQHNTHVRRSFPPVKPSRPPLVVWKEADEMIGRAVPRKARSASGKRSHDCWVSNGGDGGGGEKIHRHAWTSPARPRPAYATQVFPSSSNDPVRMKLKPISGTKQRLPKTAKSSSIQEIEIEVAEVLYGLTKQFQSPSKQEACKLDSKDTNVSIKEAKSRVSSPISSPNATSQPSVPPPPNSISSRGTSAPKKQQPWSVNFDGGSPTNPLCSSALSAASLSFAVKLEPKQPVKPEDSSPRLEQSTASAPIANGGSSLDLAAAGVPIGVQHDSAVKPESNPVFDAKVSTGKADGRDQAESKGESVSIVKEAPCSGVDVNPKEPKKGKGDMAAEKPREEKFNIDLMAPPPGKSSPEREDYATDHKLLEGEIELVSKKGDAGHEEKIEAKTFAGEILLADGKEKPMADGFDLKKWIGKEGPFDLRCDLEKPKREGLGDYRQQAQKQPSKATIMESKPVKARWPGNLPSSGYMGQVPSLQAFLPIDGSTGTSKALQVDRLKRCATHFYIARNIHQQQHLAKMNPFWPAAAGAMLLFGAKPYNLNVVPPSECTFLGNPLQGSFPGRNPGSLQSKGSGLVAAGYLDHFAAKEKGSADNDSVEAAQRKQFVPHQPGITLIFPLNQHVVAAATQSAAPASISGTNAAPASTATANSGAASSAEGPAATMNFNYTSLAPYDAQYLTVVKNNGCPFPTPPHLPGPSPYRGASPAQASPFFYSSKMLPPSQLLQQPPPQQHPLAQQGHQNTSTSSGSSSSQKQPQQSQRLPGGGAAAAGGTCAANLSVSKQHQHSSETACHDSPQAQMSIYGHNFTMPIHPQSLALISPAAAALGACGGRQNEEQPAAQHPSVKVELAPSQGLAMSFTSLSAAAAAAAIAAAAAAPQSLDLSAMVQNHALFQTLPEAAQHECQISAAVAPVQAAHQHKKAAHQDVVKSVGELTDATNTGQEGRNMMAGTQTPLSSSQHSLSFSRLENDVPVSSIPSNSVMDSSSQTLNVIQAATNGGRRRHRTAITAPAGSSTTTATASPNFQQQRQIQLQHQLTYAKSSTSGNNAGVYSDRLVRGSNASKLPQVLFGFPHVLIESGGSSSQSNQWNSSKSASTPAPPSSAPSSSMKSQLPQQQRGAYQQSPPPSVDQTRISFGVNSLKVVAGSTGQGSTPSLASANSMEGGSLQNSVTKSAGVGSPRSSTSTKSVPPASTTLPLRQQESTKNSPLRSSMKPSSVSNRNAPSILGQPHMAPIQSSSSIKQQQSQPPQKQPFPQTHLFFSGTYMQPRSTLSNAAAVYYQRQQSVQHSQQLQQQNSARGSTGVLSLSSALTLDSTPAAADTARSPTTAGGLKGTLP